MTPITPEQLDILIWKAFAKEILETTSNPKSAVDKRLKDDNRGGVSFKWHN